MPTAIVELLPIKNAIVGQIVEITAVFTDAPATITGTVRRQGSAAETFSGTPEGGGWSQMGAKKFMLGYPTKAPGVHHVRIVADDNEVGQGTFFVDHNNTA